VVGFAVVDFNVVVDFFELDGSIVFVVCFSVVEEVFCTVVVEYVVVSTFFVVVLAFATVVTSVVVTVVDSEISVC
jgi:hypothetical protein